MSTSVQRFAQIVKDLQSDSPAMKGLCAGFKVEHGTMETRYALLKDGSVLCGSATDAFGPHRNDFDFRGQSWTRCEDIPQEAEYIGWYKAPWMVR